MQIRTDSLTAQHADKVARMLQRAHSQSDPAKVTSGDPFSNMLVDGVMKVNDMQNSSSNQLEQLLTGGDVNQAEVFTGLQKADMSFRMLVQIRNKLMQAYEEINSIRV
jgi:flagellar hook-basal body complex protein FliE